VDAPGAAQDGRQTDNVRDRPGTTYEIDPERAELARENFRKAGVDKIATVVVGDAHDEVTKLEGSIDLLFLDADKDGYIDYLKKLLPKVRPGGLIVAHNMDARMGDPRFAEAITSDPDLESLLVRLQAGGISVTLKKR
jgi:predicted O-methyltransferase YrrM